MEVAAEDVHNVFVVFKEEGPDETKEPEAVEIPAPKMMGVLSAEKNAEEEQGSTTAPGREERNASLASLIPENMRGVNLLLNEVTSLSGWVQQNDRVDVFLIPPEKETLHKLTNHTVVENAIFLKENRVFGEKKERTVILAVTPEQAGHLALAYNKGSFCLVLRSSQEEKAKPAWQSKLVVG